MRRWVVLILFASTFLAAQEPKAPKHFFDVGSLLDGTYTNECLGIWFRIPDGWETNYHDQTLIRPPFRSSNGRLSLLTAFERVNLPIGNWIELNATPISDPSQTAADFVTDLVSKHIERSPLREHLLRDTTPVEFGGQKFFRSDYDDFATPDVTLRFAEVYTKYRGYFVGIRVTSPAAGDLDGAVAALQNLSLQKDQTDSTCALSVEPLHGVISGVIRAYPTVPPLPGGEIQRVNVPEKVFRELLLKEVAAQYPEEAYRKRIHGSVILRAEVSFQGKIEKLTVVSGDPALVPAAVTAAKQRQYMTYYVSGRPVEVETEMTFVFSLEP